MCNRFYTHSDKDTTVLTQIQSFFVSFLVLSSPFALVSPKELVASFLTK